MNLHATFASCLALAGLCGCAGEALPEGVTAANVSVMMMGQRFPPKPENCEIKVGNVDATTMNLTHHILAQLMVHVVDQKGRMLSGEISPELHAVLQPAACKLGGETVVAKTMGSMGGYGAASVVVFYVLRKRDAPITMPSSPPGMAPPSAPPLPPVTGPYP
jgi:hypothetical protein